MPRANFSTNLRSTRVQSWNWFGSAGGKTDTIFDHDHCHEIVDGIRRRKPGGWIEPTNYHFKRVKYRRAEGTSRQRQWDPNGNLVTDWRQSGSEPFQSNSLNLHDELFYFRGHPAGLRDQALIKARTAMKRGDLNLGVAFAERNRTAQLVGDTAKQLVKSVRSLRRGDFPGAARALGLTKPGRPRGSSVPQRWLELQYGWKPLLSDVYGSVNALAERDRRDWIVTGLGRTKEEIDTEKIYDPGETSNPKWSGSAKGKYGCYIRIDAIPENDLLLSFSSLGLTNPLLIAWELVPFSFVADWFLPVGSFLESLDAMLGYGPSYCSISQLMKCTTTVHGVSQPKRIRNNGYAMQHDEDWSTQRSEVTLDRSAFINYVPLPTMPRIKDGRSLGHMANALSLLVSAFSKR